MIIYGLELTYLEEFHSRNALAVGNRYIGIKCISAR